MDTALIVKARMEELYEKHGYNLNLLAHKAGVSPSTLKSIRYEASRNPGIITIKRVCDALGISLYEFFDTEAFRSLEPEDD